MKTYNHHQIRHLYLTISFGVTSWICTITMWSTAIIHLAKLDTNVTHQPFWITQCKSECEMSGLLFFSTCCLYAFVFITCWTVLVYHKYTFIVFKEHLFWHIKVIYEAEAQFIRFRGTKDVFIEDQSIIYE